MNIDVSTIEREYDQKRANALKDNALYVQSIYDNSPELLKINREIQKLGIEASKTALHKEDANRQEKIDYLFKQIESLKSKREEFLSKNGISLEPKYECNKCKDTGYITINNRSTMCSCMKQRLLDYHYNKVNTYKLKDETFAKFDDSVFSNEKDETKYGVKISPRENIKKIKQIAQKFIDNFNDESTKNLLFVGTAGTGKTFLSGCIANEILSKGYTVLYQTAPLLLDSVFEFKYGNKDRTSRELYDSLYNVDLLIIDDLGTESQSSAKFTELLNIINGRILNPNTKTIISTNFDINHLAKLYDDRIISRLIGEYDICKFFGNDIRVTKTIKTK